MNLGLLHTSRGEYGQALEALLASRALCEELGLEHRRAAVDVDLARAYRALNLDAEAAEACITRGRRRSGAWTCRSSWRRRCC